MVKQKNKEAFEKSLKLTKAALKFSGIQIAEKRSKFEAIINKYLYIINIFCLYTVIFGEIYWVLDGIQTGRTFVELSMTSPCITISILGTVKSIFLYLNTGTMFEIIHKLREIYPNLTEAKLFSDIREDLVAVEDVIVKESIKFLNVVTYMLTTISVLVMTMFCLMPVLTVAYDYFQKGELIIKYPYLVKYSFDVYETDFWILVYLHQVWATAIVCMNVFGSDTLFYILCTYFAMHFRLLGCKFEGVVGRDPSQTRDKLIQGIRRHQELIVLVDQSEMLFSKAMLCNIITSSLLICLSAFNVTVAEDVSATLPFVTFLLMSLAMIYLLCLFGDMLMRSSSEISEAIYNSSWHDMEHGLKKYILLVIIRAQKPCKLTAAGFADLNLRAFTTILSRSWSYFALLKTIYKQNLE